jgi:hypothetical protein
MKTLIIHPEDESTWFLNILYAPIEDATIITSGTKAEVRELIKSHDRIMMMGHGSPGGLFCVGQFSDANGFVIDQSFVPLLRDKKDCVFIWCHASDFVEKHGLSGFACGMFISEVGEAGWCGVRSADQPMVDDSNFLFMNEAAKAIRGSAEDLHRQVTTGAYAKLARKNPVAGYNHKRLKLFNGSLVHEKTAGRCRQVE